MEPSWANLTARLHEIYKSANFRAAGYSSRKDFCDRHNLHPDTIRKVLDSEHVTDSVLRAITSLTDEATGSELRILRGALQSETFFNRRALTLGSVIEHFNDDSFVERRARHINETHLGSSAPKDEEAALHLLRKSVIANRVNGNYRKALIQGLLLCSFISYHCRSWSRWRSLYNAFTAEVFKTAAQAQNIKIMRFVSNLSLNQLRLDPADPLAERAYADQAAQTILVSHVSTPRKSKKCLAFFDRGIEVSKSILKNPSGSMMSREQIRSLAEVPYNRVTAMISVGVESGVVEQEFLRMAEFCDEADALLSSSAFDGPRNDPWEEQCFRRILFAQFLLLRKDEFEQTIVDVNKIIASLGEDVALYPFLAGSAHLLAGRAKIRHRDMYHSHYYDNQVEQHQDKAIAAFGMINSNMGVDMAKRLLRI